jgi:predicted enzyme related to lactoylglutathione lyase
MTHPYGTFCFAELNTHDITQAQRFYGTVFGWKTEPLAEDGGYLVFQQNGRDVAALRHGKGPTRWIPYLAVESADQTTIRARDLRASVVAPPFDLDGLARKAVIHDPAGGVIGLWEPRGHGGAAVLDEPGSMWWAELVTRDFPSAQKFYAGLLGWRAVDTLKYGIRYSVFKLGDQAVAGLLPIGADWGPVSPYWQVLFAVDGCDAAVERARAAGGSLVFGPNDIPNAGRAGIVTDPAGAIFVVMEPSETQS